TTPAMISPAQLAQVGGGGWEYSPVVATTSGTAFDFTGIPEGVSEVEILFSQVSLTTADQLLVQIGNSSGLVTTGYASASSRAGAAIINSTDGFIATLNNAALAFSGVMQILSFEGSDEWVSGHSGNAEADRPSTGGGRGTMVGNLDSVRITRTGTGSFDGGSVQVRWRK
ncbi:hypothetical protein, partial [Roseovarius autotrophicus]|uniref:hypothetical protein n=1 Tax=Roseovarius autotrophicus TaxID=2824121 RepID=UPI001B3647C1